MEGQIGLHGADDFRWREYKIVNQPIGNRIADRQDGVPERICPEPS